MDLTSAFARTKRDGDNLEGQILKRGLFKEFKIIFCKLVKYKAPGKVSGKDAPNRSISMNTIQKMT